MELKVIKIQKINKIFSIAIIFFVFFSHIFKVLAVEDYLLFDYATHKKHNINQFEKILRQHYSEFNKVKAVAGLKMIIINPSLMETELTNIHNKPKKPYSTLLLIGFKNVSDKNILLPVEWKNSVICMASRAYSSVYVKASTATDNSFIAKRNNWGLFAHAGLDVNTGDVLSLEPNQMAFFKFSLDGFDILEQPRPSSVHISLVYCNTQTKFAVYNINGTVMKKNIRGNHLKEEVSLPAWRGRVESNKILIEK